MKKNIIIRILLMVNIMSQLLLFRETLYYDHLRYLSTPFHIVVRVSWDWFLQFFELIWVAGGSGNMMGCVVKLSSVICTF